MIQKGWSEKNTFFFSFFFHTHACWITRQMLTDFHALFSGSLVPWPMPFSIIQPHLFQFFSKLHWHVSWIINQTVTCKLVNFAPWFYNLRGWLGTKHKVTYSLTPIHYYYIIFSPYACICKKKKKRRRRNCWIQLKNKKNLTCSALTVQTLHTALGWSGSCTVI